MKKLYFFLVAFIFSTLIQAQNQKIDSLKTLLNSTSHDTVRANALTELAKIYIKSKDSVEFISVKTQLGQIFEKTKLPKIGNVYYLIQANYEEKVNQDKEKALEFYKKSYEYCLKANDKASSGKRVHRIAGLLLDFGNYKEAIKYYYKAIEVNKEINNLVGVSYAYYGLGEVFRLQKNNKKALEIYYLAYELALKTNDKAALTAGYNNIGMMYNILGFQDSALYYYNKSVDFNTKNNNELGVAGALDRIANVYLTKRDNAMAAKILEKALSIKLKYSNKEELATTYIKLTETYYSLEKDDIASKYLEKAIKLSEEAELIEFLEYCYKLQGYIYKAQGKFQNSSISLIKYIELHDSLINQQNSRLVSELEEKYQNDKKKKEIEILNKDKILQETNIKKQKQFSYFIAIVAILLVITVFFILRGLRQKHKDNKMLFEKNEIINEQKTIVEEKNKEITDSINYAKRIQYTLLAHDYFLNENLREHFVLFKPKDIVSGDFYWAAKKDNKFFLAVCDSTGHGVPGAFMCLLNISFLNEAINERNILSPNEILNYVRKRLIETVSKDGQQDGFDGIILCIEGEKITYAAANNSPLHISNGTFIETKCDKMPVGIGPKKEDFELFDLNSKKGDVIYLYTDGYADQFGGTKGKKFMYKKLNEMLLENSSKELNQQKSLFTETFETWRGNLEQIDDVCIIGIRV